MGKLPYSPAIDGLRAVAVLAVVAYHAGLGGAGYVGVDVFFVISGYLITRLLRGGFDFLDFYARRVRRIFPAAAVVVLVTLGLSALLLTPNQQAHTANSAGAALVFGANVFFQATTGGYFDAKAEEMPLLHLWSLSVEEQFYLLWPLLMLLRRHWLVVVALASFVLAEALPQPWAFYEMPPRAWELAAGGLVAVYAPRIRHASLLGSVLVAFAIVVPMPSFPGIGALPAVMGAALIIAGAHHDEPAPWLRPLAPVGLISYSLYLWHWPLLALYRANGGESLGVRLALCLLAVGLAVLTYRYVEQPFRRMRFPSGRTVAAGAVVSVALASSACAVGFASPQIVLPDQRCHSTEHDGPIPKCSGGRIAIWGDSMAFAWSPIAEVSYTRNACSPMGQSVADDPNCRAFADNAARRVAGADTLYIVARWRIYSERMDDVLRRVAPTVKHVVILGPTPQLRAATCPRWRDTCSVPRAEFDAQAAPILASLRAAAKPYANIRVVDLTDQFCTAEKCPPELYGVALYWDKHHPSPAAVIARRKSLMAASR